MTYQARILFLGLVLAASAQTAATAQTCSTWSKKTYLPSSPPAQDALRVVKVTGSAGSFDAATVGSYFVLGRHGNTMLESYLLNTTGLLPADGNGKKWAGTYRYVASGYDQNIRGLDMAAYGDAKVAIANSVRYNGDDSYLALSVIDIANQCATPPTGCAVNNRTFEVEYSARMPFYNRNIDVPVYADVFPFGGTTPTNIMAIGSGNLFGSSTTQDLFTVMVNPSTNSITHKEAYSFGEDVYLKEVIRVDDNTYYLIGNTKNSSGDWEGFVGYLTNATSSSMPPRSMIIYKITSSAGEIELLCGDYRNIDPNNNELILGANFTTTGGSTSATNPAILKIAHDFSSPSFSVTGETLSSSFEVSRIKYVGSNGDYVAAGTQEYWVPEDEFTLRQEVDVIAFRRTSTGALSWAQKYNHPNTVESANDLLIDGCRGIIVGSTGSQYSGLSLGLDIANGQTDCKYESISFTAESITMSTPTTPAVSSYSDIITLSSCMEAADAASAYAQYDLCCNNLAITLSGPSTVCTSDWVTFTLSGVPDGATVYWYDDGLKVSEVADCSPGPCTLTYGRSYPVKYGSNNQPQPYTMRVLVIEASGCMTNPQPSLVTINPIQTPDATFSPGTFCYDPLVPVLFTNDITYNDPSLTSLWTYEYRTCPTCAVSASGSLGSDVNTSGPFLYIDDGYYLIKHTLTRNSVCIHEFSREYHIEDYTPYFEPLAVCRNKGEKAFKYTGTTQAKDFEWYYYKGTSGGTFTLFSTEREPAFPFGAVGSYTVKLKTKVAGECNWEHTNVVEITEPVSADFNYHRDATDLVFVPAATGTGITHSWTFPPAIACTSPTPDCETAEQPAVSNPATGTYQVCHTVTKGGCSTTVCKWICSDPPKAVFTGPATLCQSTDAKLNTYTFTSAASVADERQWYLDDAPLGRDVTQDIIFLTGGEHTITLRAIKNCNRYHEDVYSQTVNVTSAPDPKIIFERTGSLTGNLTAGGSIPSGINFNYSWKIGTTNVGTQSSFAHTFSQAGPHTVELTITDPSGCFDPIIITLKICLDNIGTGVACCNCD